MLGTVHQALFGRRKPAEAEEPARGMPTGIAYGNPALPDATPAAERGPARPACPRHIHLVSHV